MPDRLAGGRYAADTAHAHAQAARKRGRRNGAAQAEQQFVVLAAAQRERRIVADGRAVGRGKRHCADVDFGADSAAFENVAEVLPQSVAQIDRGRRRFDASQAKPSLQACGRLQEAVDKELARGGACAELSRENSQSGGGIAHSAGYIDGVAGTCGVAPERRAAHFAEQRDGDRERARAGDIAADHFDFGAGRRALQSPVHAIEESHAKSVAHREVDHAYGRLPAHRGDIAQVNRQRARAERLRRSPCELEMHVLDHRVDSQKLAGAGGGQDRTIVAGPQDSAAARAEALQQALDQVEFSGRFAHMVRQAAKGVTRILRAGCRALRHAAKFLAQRSRNHARAFA